MKHVFVTFFCLIVFYTPSIGQMRVIETADTSASTNAAFPGGATGWRMYLEKNLNANFTTEAKALPGIYRVKVEFSVDKEGNITHARAVSVTPDCKPCANEAVRVIQSSPRWLPAKEAGNTVAKTQTQMISFMATGERYLVTDPVLVQFEKLTLREAIKKAAATGKIVFAQFISDKCDECNETADMAMRSPNLATLIYQKCIALKIEINHNDRKEFIESYNPNQSIGTYFISGDEDLLSHYSRTSSRPSDYIAEVEKALAKQIEGRVTLKELNEEWRNNPANTIAMEMNLRKRMEFGWSTDSLLEVYINRLPTDSLVSKRVLQFIATLAPSIFSQANRILRKDEPLFTRLWYEMPVETRVTINRRIIYKSLHKAIDVKDKNMAARVASFAMRTHTSDTATAARKDFEKQILEYNKSIKDTAASLQSAIHYYDTYFMALDANAVRTKDSINMRKAFDTARVEKVEDPITKGRFVTTRRISYVPMSGFLAAELNQGAWLVYSSSRNPLQLQKGLSWARRAKELSRSPDYQNIYARLLYVNGDNSAAIAEQKENIQRLKQQNRKTSASEALLAQMEANGKLREGL